MELTLRQLLHSDGVKANKGLSKRLANVVTLKTITPASENRKIGIRIRLGNVLNLTHQRSKTGKQARNSIFADRQLTTHTMNTDKIERMQTRVDK